MEKIENGNEQGRFDLSRTMAASIILQKCPRCRQSPLFTHKAYDLKNFMKMPEYCDCCQQKYELHTSFFYGAMYISYALQVAWFTFIWIIFAIFFPDSGYTAKATTIIVSAVLLLPLVLRWSRAIWIHLFVKYDRTQGNCKS